jgi:hypothetical protein
VKERSGRRRKRKILCKKTHVETKTHDNIGDGDKTSQKGKDRNKIRMLCDGRIEHGT